VKKALSAFALAVTALVGTTAHAEPMTGSRQELVDNTRAYAKCKVRGNRDRARKLVLSNVSDAQLERRFDDFDLGRPIAELSGCDGLVIRAGLAFRLQPAMLRGALADELVRLELRDGPIKDVSGRPALNHWQPESEGAYQERLAKAKNPRQRKIIEQDQITAIAGSWLSVFGECAVRKDPANAWAWVMSRPDSASEATAITGISPALADCLTDGRKLNFAKDVLRASVATNYYRVAMTAPATLTGVTS